MNWDDRTAKKARELARGPLGQQLGKLPLQYAAGVMIISQDENRKMSIRTATVTLVDTGKMKLAITCNHVLESYRGACQSSDQCSFQIGGLSFDPETRVVSENKKADLVTLDLEGLDFSKISDDDNIGQALYSPRTWPPSRVENTNVVSLAGFPEVWREQETRGEFVFPAFSVATVFASGVSDDQFGINLEREYWVESFNYDNREYIHNFSGMSGSPVVIERTNGVRRFDVVGIAKEFNESLDYVYVAHLDLVDADGQIDF